MTDTVVSLTYDTDEQRWRYSGSVTTGNASIILLPSRRPDRKVSVGVVPNSATASVQHSLSTAALVEAGTATWRDWAAGDVTAAADDTLIGPVTALRIASSGGTTAVEVLI